MVLQRRALIASLLGFAVFTASAARAAPDSGEFPVPGFDHRGVPATYVVSLPPDHDPARRYPLILDFHGAISPAAKGANLTRAAVWSKFVRRIPCIVAGLNGRTRAWGMIRGERDDRAYALRVLDLLAEKYAIDPERIYLAGFSSGSDFLCKGGLQLTGRFAGSLVICSGPGNVLGLRGGELVKAKDTPFLFAAGEEDYVRKSGSWEACLALKKAGGRAEYVEVPGKGHEFFGIDVYVRLFGRLEQMAGHGEGEPAAEPATDAEAREEIRRARAVDELEEPGRAYEAWWRILTRYHSLGDRAAEAEKELARIEAKIPRSDLYRARKDFFRRRGSPPGGSGPLFGFDRYLGYREITAGLAHLARRFPDRARLRSMGKSVEGRDLWVLEITRYRSGPPESKPAVYLQGAIHGNEACAAMTALYAAWQFAANPERSRGTDRLTRDVTLYVTPMVNPDALDHFLGEPHSHWRPRFNYRPHDADGDGRVDEDPYEDLNGDGEIGLMYAPDPEGPYVLKDGRMVRGSEGKRYRLVGREGIDDDGDGKYSEDRPGGVDLNRNFPVGFVSRKHYEGTSGPEAASEPEARAVMEFVSAHPNVALFLDVHSDGDCTFCWLGPDGDEDLPFYEALTARARSSLGYAPRLLRHSGAGLAIAWAYGERGIPAMILELESARGEKEEYYCTTWGGDAFVPPKPFAHPQLGPILIGNDYRKLARHNLHPSDLFWQADRVFAWLKSELDNLPKLELREPYIEPVEGGYRVTGRIANAGASPTDSARAAALGRALPILPVAEGATIAGTARLAGLAPGEEAPFTIRLKDVGESATLCLGHPRGGTVELPIVSPRSPTRPIRRKYELLPGYATVETARRASNGFYRDGVSPEERGPAFDLKHEKDELRIAVLLGEWEDHGHRVPASEFERAFFSRGGYRDRSATGQPVYGSVREFYAEMSLGRLDVSGTVFDWVTLPGTYAEYRDASFGSPMLRRKLAQAVKARDGDGALDGYDGLVFVWAGNAVRRTSMLWPMRVTLTDRPGTVAFKMSELFHGEVAPIGVACHELAHTFGVNDKYGLGASKNPLGPWCLIGKGTHGGPPSGRHRPFPLCAWCRMVIGWLAPTVIDPSTPQKLALRPVLLCGREAYRVILTPDGSEYLLLTNHRREGFLTDLPSPGLVVLKVGPNDKPASPQVRVELLPAHGLPPAARSDPAAPERIAWPQPGRDGLTVGGVRISGIRLVDDVAYFEVGPAR